MSKDLDFYQLINNRYSWSKKVVKIKFFSIFIWLITLILITFLLYYITYYNHTSILGINLETVFFYKIKYYLYWIIFFNNILIPVILLYLYYLFTDNIDTIIYHWERKKMFNDDETLNI